MWPFNTRRCRCGDPRRVHRPEWGWTTCTRHGCDCVQFRWVRARLYWDAKFRRADEHGWRRG